MSMTWGPGLDAELTYRREQVAAAVARPGPARVRRPRHAVAAPSAPRTLPTPRHSASAPAAATDATAGARAA